LPTNPIAGIIRNSRKSSPNRDDFSRDIVRGLNAHVVLCDAPDPAAPVVRLEIRDAAVIKSGSAAAVLGAEIGGNVRGCGHDPELARIS
jgi:hypothetical protein